MPTSDPFIRSYLDRIAYDGPLDVSLATLRALNVAHAASIPFENISSFMGIPPRLDLPSLQAKLIDGGRGGYCFEQNTLLCAVLTRLGFCVTPLAGRVVWMQPPDGPPTPRSHMLLRVETEVGPHIVDVGFGGHIMTAPLRLASGESQKSLTGSQRIVEGVGQYAVEVELPRGWIPTYRFTLDPHLPVDFEPLNWFTATHESSLFVANLLLERVTPEVRFSLFNEVFTIRRKDQPPETRRIGDQADFTQALTDAFKLPATLPFGTMFERLATGVDGPTNHSKTNGEQP